MATVEETMMKVQRLLTGALGLKVGLQGDTYSVSFENMSTSVQLRVKEWVKSKEGEPQSLIVISSMLLRNVKPTPALFEWVARNGGSRWFGHVEVYDEKDTGTVMLIMSHTLLGDYLDEKELYHGMFAVLHSADEWDDVLQKQFGGKRWTDAS